MSALGSIGSRLREPRTRRVLTVLAVLWLVTIPFTTTAYITEVFFTGLVFVMLGVSWNLVAGYAGQISLGHAAFFGFGAFVSAWLTSPGRAGLPESIQMPVVVAIAGGALAAAILALVVGPVMFRLTGHYFAIGTLALASIIQLILLDQRQFSGGSTGYYVQQSFGDDLMFLLALATTVGMYLVYRRIVASPSGLGMRAIHDDEGAASSLGVYPLKFKMYAFVVSSAMAGIAGGFWAQYTLFISADSTLSVVWMVDTLVIVVLGGMGSLLGPVYGAWLFLGLDTVLQRVGGEFATTVEGTLIIAFVLLAPKGVNGILRTWFDDDESGTAADHN